VKARISAAAEKRFLALPLYVSKAAMRITNVFISMKKMSEGDPGRAAAAALTFDHTKNVFVFDDDIDVFNPTDILWHLRRACSLTSRCPILQPLFRGNFLDPSLVDEIKHPA